MTKRELLKECIKKIITEELRLGDRSSLSKYTQKFEKALKSAVGKHASVVTGDIHDIVLDDGEGGLAFDVTIRPISRDCFDVEHIIGSGERGFTKGLTSDEIVDWIKKALKETKDFETKEKEEIDGDDSHRKIIKKPETQEKIADKEDVKAEIEPKKKETEEKAAVQGMADATDFDRQEDAKMKKDKVADGTDYKKKVGSGMEKAKEKAQADIKSKKVTLKADTEDPKKTHIVKP